MHLTAILLFGLTKVVLEVNCVAIGKVALEGEVNSRRRDIQFDATSQPYIYTNKPDVSDRASQIKSIPRQNVLLPDLDSTGRPRCLTRPDDTFCESVNNYPNSTLKQDIEYSPPEFLEIFGNNIDGRRLPSLDDSVDERVCGRIPRVIVPKMAENQENQWVYIVNEVEYTQAVVAEICEKEGKPCAYLERNLPPGMFSRCRQKYSYKRLLALHPTEKRTYSDTFKFPSCCACYVKSSDILSKSIKNKRKN